MQQEYLKPKITKVRTQMIERKQKILRSNLNGNAVPFYLDLGHVTKLQEKSTTEHAVNTVMLEISKEDKEKERNQHDDIVNENAVVIQQNTRVDHHKEIKSINSTKQSNRR